MYMYTSYDGPGFRMLHKKVPIYRSFNFIGIVFAEKKNFEYFISFIWVCQTSLACDPETANK